MSHYVAFLVCLRLYFLSLFACVCVSMLQKDYNREDRWRTGGGCVSGNCRYQVWCLKYVHRGCEEGTLVGRRRPPSRTFYYALLALIRMDKSGIAMKPNLSYGPVVAPSMTQSVQVSIVG